MAVPPMPPGVSLQDNIALANNRRMHLKPGSAFTYSWFYSQVRGRGPWDYKQNSREYEAFGNFNCGVTGTVLGIPEGVLLRAAGAAQKTAGASRPEFGDWWGDAPYGDDHSDQHWIKEGIEYARAQGY